MTISSIKIHSNMVKEALIMGASVRLVELNDGSANLHIDSIKVTRTDPNQVLNNLREVERKKVVFVRF